MRFQDIVGQKKVISQLISSKRENRVSHAQLFLGKEGSGNLALALAYIQYLNCANPSDSDSCGTCPSCLKISGNQHPDLHYSFPIVLSASNKTTNAFLPVWREALQHSPYMDLAHWVHVLEAENKQLTMGVDEARNIASKLNLKAYEGGNKYMLIWRPERMRPDASNKLLKLIEEPPPRTYFFLISCDTENILPTILSRTQVLRLDVLAKEEIEQAISSKFDMDSNEMDSVVNLSDGIYYKALQMSRHRDESRPAFENFVAWMRYCYKLDVVELSNWIDNMLKQGREEQKQFLIYTLHMMRQCIAGNYSDGELSLLGKMEQSFADNFSPFINETNIIEINNAISEAHRDIARNVYGKIVFMDLSMTMNKLIRQSQTA